MKTFDIDGNGRSSYGTVREVKRPYRGQRSRLGRHRTKRYVQVMMSMYPEDRAKLDKLAEILDCSRSGAMRALIDAYQFPDEETP